MDFVDSDESDFDFDVLQVIVLRRKRKIKERPDFFHYYDDVDFRDRFRMCKDAAWFIFSLIKEKIYIGTRNNAMQPHQMFFITLRFYASGSFQQTVADLCGVSKTSASRAIKLVSHHIASLRADFVKLPQTEQERLSTQAAFKEISNFPRVIGAMDCTHVKIMSPGGDDGEVFRNRKGFFSFNVQTICDSNLKILDIVARWPGSVHDSRIFRNSRISYRLEAKEFLNAVIVADSGYENTNVVLTPLLNCRNRAENLYNESHIRTRNCIERSYGVWKRRFPVLSMGIRMKVTTVPYIIVATAVLNNVCIRFNDKTAPQLVPEIDDAVTNVLTVPPNRSNEGRSRNDQTRKTIIDTYFAQM
ncbi:putative nuclease HARBI1 [Rhagoletis pomonella]|uniref:putative nuclease HARBI1 n=1 Tax=Rhagoletis pomonella TaxID=28610 RepID=UPI001782E09D|nr:putative nuclease HARBI1 [Rhagoletis pomonella]